MTRRVRVLFVISDLGGGGAERAVSTYLARLDRARFEPALCLWRDIRTYSVPADVPVWVINKTRPWHLPRAVLATARLIRTWRPDAISSHMGFVNLVTGLAIGLAGWKGYWCPCFRTNPRVEIRPWLRPVYRRVLARADRVLGNSDALRKALAGMLRLSEERSATLYNPFALDQLPQAVWETRTSPPPRPTLVTMGRLVKAKDHATLLRAFAKVRQRRDARLVILGQGPLHDATLALARRLGVLQHLEMPGFVAEPWQVLAQGDVFVLSSRWEGMPNAMIEAMGTGLPAVATRCSFGPEEIIQDGVNGLLVAVGNADAMAEAILRLLDDPALAARMARQGRRRVNEMFSASVRVRFLEELLANAAGTSA